GCLPLPFFYVPSLTSFRRLGVSRRGWFRSVLKSMPRGTVLKPSRGSALAHPRGEEVLELDRVEVGLVRDLLGQALDEDLRREQRDRHHEAEARRVDGDRDALRERLGALVGGGHGDGVEGLDHAEDGSEQTEQ